eukprot:10523868-Alexandrium_andersonii.AAC.1
MYCRAFRRAPGYYRAQAPAGATEAPRGPRHVPEGPGKRRKALWDFGTGCRASGRLERTHMLQRAGPRWCTGMPRATLARRAA